MLQRLLKYSFGIAIAAVSILFVVPTIARAETVTYKAKIVDPDGAVLSNVYVSTYKADWSSYYSGYTDNSGIIRFYDQPSGTYTVSISKPWGASYASPAPYTVDITSTETKDAGTIYMKRPNISGRLLGQDGQAVQSQYVSIHDKNWTVSDYAYTDYNGRFKLFMQKKGTYQFYTYDNSTYKFLSPGEFDVTLAVDEETKDLGDISSVTPNLKGIYTDKNGNAINSAGVSVYSANYTVSKWANTNSSGVWNVYIPVGTYTIKYYGYNSKADAADQTVTITDVSKLVDQGTIKQPSENVTITLKDPTGAAVNGASLYLNNTSYSIYRSMTTNASGVAETSLTTTDTYTIQTWANSAKYSDPKNYTLSFTAGQTYNIELTLRTPGMLIDVKDPDGNAIQYASVSVNPKDSYDWQNSDWKSTDAAGRAAVKPLATGSYTVNVYFYQYNTTDQWVAPSQATIALTEGNQDTTYTGTNALKFSRPTKTFKGKITDEDGNGLVAYISGWQSNNWSRSIYGTSAADGSFTLKGGGGTYQLYIGPNSWPASWGFFEKNPTVEFKDDSSVETVEKNFKGTSFNSTIKGTARYGDGSIPPSTEYASIYASDPNMPFWGYSQVNSSDGSWTMKAPAGTFSISGYSSNSNFASPSQTTISVNTKETYDAGKIVFPQKKEKIALKVVDTNGAAISGAWANAWRKTGTYDYAWGNTTSDGTVTLNVGIGEYEVTANYYSWFSTDSKKYASIEGPKTVELTAEETENVTITLGIADSTVNVSMVGPDGKLVSDYNGWADLSSASSTSTYSWSGLGGGISGGKGTLAVPGGKWKLRVYGWGSKWSVTGDPTFEIGSSTSKDLEVTLDENNSTINGTLVDGSGTTLTSLNAWVFAMNTNGNYQYATPKDGKFKLQVSKGTWDVSVNTWGNDDFILDPDNNLKVEIAANEEKSLNVTYQKVDSAIKVTVTDPDGNPKANTSVFLEKELGKGAVKTTDNYWYGMQEYTNKTDQKGIVTIKAPAGTYYVSATAGASEGLMNPEAKVVELKKDKTAEETLQFEKADAQIKGTVTLNGTATDSTVYAYSTDGEQTQGASAADGSYTINVKSGEGETKEWYVSAVNEEETKAYATEAETLVNADQADKTYTADLVLDSDPLTLPNTETTTVDANTQSSIVLSDDTEVVIPANSLSTADINVNVTVQATAEIPKTADDYPIEGMGYEIDATKATGADAGVAIETLASPCSITLKYDEADLAKANVKEDEITVKSYSEEEGTYRNTDTVIVNEVANEVTFTTSHFSIFAIVAAGSKAAAGGTVPSVSLTNPADKSSVSVAQVLAEGIVSDAKATVTIKLNDSSIGKVTVSDQGAFSEKVSGLVVGDNTIEVTAKNENGTSAKVARTVTYQPATAGGGGSGDGSDSGGGGDLPTLVATGVQKDLVVYKSSGSSEVRVLGQDGTVKQKFNAFAAKVTGSYHLLVSDIDGDGTEEILASTGKGLAPQIRVFKRSGQLVTQLYAYSKTGKMGAKFILADLTGDNIPELITRPVSGATSQVKVYSYKSAKKKYRLLTEAAVFAKSITTEFRLTASDVTGDGKLDLIAAPADNETPAVRVFTYEPKRKTKLKLAGSFYAYSKSKKIGMRALASDLTGDGKNEIVIIPTTGKAATINAYRYSEAKKKFVLLDTVMPYKKSFKGEMDARVGDINGDDRTDLIVFPKSKYAPSIAVYSLSQSDKWQLVTSVNAFEKKYTGGLDAVITNVDADDYPEIAVMKHGKASPELRLYEYDATKAKLSMLDSIVTHAKSIKTPMEMMTVDLKGDGDYELIIGPAAGSPTVSILDWSDDKDQLEATASFLVFSKSYKDGVKLTSMTNDEAPKATKQKKSSQKNKSARKR